MLDQFKKVVVIVLYCLVITPVIQVNFLFSQSDHSQHRYYIEWEKVIVRPEHPRLFITPENLEDHRKRLNPAHPAWQQLQNKAKMGEPAETALLYLMTGQNSYAKQVATNLRKKSPDWTEYSLAFDWAFFGWDAVTQQEMIDLFAERFGFHKEGFPAINQYTDLNQKLPSQLPKSQWPGYYNWTFHSEDWADGSRTSEKYSPYFALAGHVDRASKGVQRIWEMSFKDATLFLSYLGDGSYWEGGYWAFRAKLEKIAAVFRVLSSATQLDFLGYDFPYLHNVGYFLIYQTDIATKRLVAPYGDDGNFLSDEWKVRYGLLAINAIAKNPYYQYYLDFFTQPTAALKEALYYDPRIKARPLNELPLSRYFDGTRLLLFRSGWQGKDDLIGMFRFSDWFDIHNHNDAGHFMLYRNGVLVGKAGYYGDEYSSGVKHNIVTIEQQKSDIQNSNGGQRTFPRTWSFKIGKRAWVNTPEIFQRGKLIGLDSAPKYDYISADLAPAYQKDQINQYTRELVYIRPEIIIIHDRLDSKANSTKKFLLHLVNQPAMSGMQLDEHWQNYTGDFIISKGSGESTLFMKSLLPSATRVRAVLENSAKIDTVRFAVAPWRLELSPVNNASPSYQFLNILCAAAPSTQKIPDIDKLPIAADIGMEGILIFGGSYQWILTYKNSAKTNTKCGYVVNQLGELNHLVTGLTPAANYVIHKNGNQFKTGQTSEAGTIYFVDTVPNSTKYEIMIQ